MYALHAAVVMPDHVHILITPGLDESGQTFGIAQIMQAVKGISAHAVNGALHRRGRVWQPEYFDRALRNNERIRAGAEYICANPVRASLVSVEDDWPWIWRSWVEGEFLPNPSVAGEGARAPSTARDAGDSIERASKHGQG